MRILRKLKVKTLGNIYIYVYICCDRGKKTETILSSLQACFVIAHSSGDFIVKNICTIVTKFLGL